jgi:hypothetical protein
MMKTILVVFLIVSAFSISPIAAQGDMGSRDIIFGKKTFVDNPEILGGFVSISGTVTGDGLAYKNNTVNIFCYRDRMECWAVKIDQTGPNQIGSLRAPNLFLIATWNADEVVADNGMNCPRITVILDRKAQTASWIRGVINASDDLGDNPCTYPDKQIYKWTIEDPPWAR